MVSGNATTAGSGELGAIRLVAERTLFHHSTKLLTRVTVGFCNSSTCDSRTSSDWPVSVSNPPSISTNSRAPNKSFCAR